MAVSEQEKTVQELTKGLEDLKHAFDLYFQGLERLPPVDQRTAYTGKLRKTKETLSGKNTALKFRINQLWSSLQTYDNKWNRILKEIEEGTYKRDKFKVSLRKKKWEQEGKAQPPGEAAKVDDTYEVDDLDFDADIVEEEDVFAAAPPPPAPKVPSAFPNSRPAVPPMGASGVMAPRAAAPASSAAPQPAGAVPRAVTGVNTPVVSGPRPVPPGTPGGGPAPVRPAGPVPPLGAAGPRPVGAPAPAAPGAPRPAGAPPAPAGARPVPPVSSPALRPVPAGPPAAGRPVIQPAAPGTAAPRPVAPVGAPAAAPRPAAAAAPAVSRPPAPAAGGGVSDEAVRRIHSELAEAKRRVGDSSPSASLDALKAQLSKQVPAIKQQHGAKDVEFKVDVKDGKAILKAIPRK